MLFEWSIEWWCPLFLGLTLMGWHKCSMTNLEWGLLWSSIFSLSCLGQRIYYVSAMGRWKEEPVHSYSWNRAFCGLQLLGMTHANCMIPWLETVALDWKLQTVRDPSYGCSYSEYIFILLTSEVEITANCYSNVTNSPCFSCAICSQDNFVQRL
jgi:hypothetical protein